MEAILAWQLAVAVSIIVARLFSSGAMITVAMCWTDFTLLVVWTHWLVLIQLGTAWGTVWLLSSLVPKPGRSDKKTLARAAVTDLAATSTYSTATDVPTLGLQKSAERAEEAVGSWEQTVDRFSSFVEAHREKQKANSELLQQLFSLKISIEAALERGKRQIKRIKEIERIGVSEEKYQKEIQKYEDLFPKTDLQPFLGGLTLSPQAADGLSELAIEERRNSIKEALRQLDQANDQIRRDAALLAAVNKGLPTPLDQFVTQQSDLLRRHLSLLSPPEQAATRSTVANTHSPTTVTLLGTIGTKLTASGTLDFGGVTVDPLGEYIRRVKAGQARAPAPMSASMHHVLREAVAQERLKRQQALASIDPSAKGASTTETSSGTALRTRAVEIERVVRDLHAPHLVHFTRCDNLASILKHGLMSVAVTELKGVVAVRNDERRWDGQLDGTSLSIAFPNYSMFYKYRQIALGTDWAVLIISTRVLWEKDCAFYRHNAADARMIRRPRAEMKSPEALADMFNGDDGRDPFLRTFDPTDPQAEVMVYETIEPGFIEAVAFETAEVRTKHLHRLGGRESICAGPGRGLFATRQYTRAN